MYKKKPKPMKALTKSQKDKLKQHSIHHTKKHIDAMRNDMKKGISFTQAHKKAMKKVGK